MGRVRRQARWPRSPLPRSASPRGGRTGPLPGARSAAATDGNPGTRRRRRTARRSRAGISAPPPRTAARVMTPSRPGDRPVLLRGSQRGVGPNSRSATRGARAQLVNRPASSSGPTARAPPARASLAGRSWPSPPGPDPAPAGRRADRKAWMCLAVQAPNTRRAGTVRPWPAVVRRPFPRAARSARAALPVRSPRSFPARGSQPATRRAVWRSSVLSPRARLAVTFSAGGWTTRSPVPTRAVRRRSSARPRGCSPSFPHARGSQPSRRPVELPPRHFPRPSLPAPPAARTATGSLTPPASPPGRRAAPPPALPGIAGGLGSDILVPTAVRPAHGPAQRDELPRSGGEDGREGLVRLAGLRRGAGPDCVGAGARL